MAEETNNENPQQINLDTWVSLIGRQTLQIDALQQHIRSLEEQLSVYTDNKNNKEQ